MAEVYLSIGSNIQREKHILAGIHALKRRYAPIFCSPIYESVAVGFEGENFYNLAARFSTEDSLTAVIEHLAIIEDENGRDRSGPKFGPRTLDLDLLLYDDLIIESEKLVLPRPETYKNAFVLRPLADIADNLVDPISKQTFGRLWQDYDHSKQKLWPIELDPNS